MEIIRKSMLSGITRTMELPITEEDYQEWLSGALIQEAMPHLTDDEREFLITGITADEWDEAMTEWEEDY